MTIYIGSEAGGGAFIPTKFEGGQGGFASTKIFLWRHCPHKISVKQLLTATLTT